MLNKVVDNTIIGDSYISYIKGIVQLLTNKKVLILNPETEVTSKSATFVSGLEIEYLKQLGTRWGVAPLCHLDMYLIQQDYIVQVYDTLIHLSDSSYMNLCELFRKCTHFLDLNQSIDMSFFREKDADFITDFNEKFQILIMRLSVDLLSSESWQVIKDEKFFALLFEDLRPFVKQFTSGGNKEFLDSFYLLLGSAFHKNICYEKLGSENLLLLIHLLSPRFKLDEKKLLLDLQLLFRKLGGREFYSKITDWDFCDKDLMTIQLDCFEGLCKTEKLEVMDNDPFSKQSYGLEKIDKFYTKYKSTFSYPTTELSVIWNEKLFYGISTKGSRGILLWEIVFKDSHFEISFLLPYVKGTHSEKIRNTLKQFIQNMFVEQFFELSLTSLNTINMIFDPQLDRYSSEVSVVAFCNGQKRRSPNINYSGSFRGHKFGNISLLKSLSL